MTEGTPGEGLGFLVRAVGCADHAIVPGATPPPGCAVRSCLSASGLQALTHSPLLFQGKTPSSQRKDARGNLLEVLETSPGSNFCPLVSLISSYLRGFQAVESRRGRRVRVVLSPALSWAPREVPL